MYIGDFALKTRKDLDIETVTSSPDMFGDRVSYVGQMKFAYPW